jgi:hypothetical protein
MLLGGQKIKVELFGVKMETARLLKHWYTTITLHSITTQNLHYLENLMSHVEK